VLVKLANGSTIVEAPVSGDLFATADGCAVASQTTAGYDIISADGLVSASVSGDLVAFAPDGKAIVTEQDRRQFLAPVTPPPESDPDDADEQSDAGIDIGRTGRLVSFTQL
jgi:hypothetical protein